VSEQQQQQTSQRHSTLVAGAILLSRLSGLARERTIAYFLGTSLAANAFKAALRIPNLLQNLLGEGVLSASFIPSYARLLSEGRRDEAGRVAGAVVGLLASLTALLVIVGVALAGPLTSLIAPGFTGEQRELTVTLVRILTPGLGFLVLSAWCLGVLNSHRRFFLSYVAPVLWNIAQITALVAAGLTILRGETNGLAVALAWGALAGSLLQVAVQAPGAVRALPGGLRPSLRTDLEGVRRTVRAFGPIVSGRGVVQLSAYLDLVLASFLVGSAVALLGYAQTLYLLPISVFGMSVAAAELPELSSSDPAEREGFARRLDDGLGRIAFYVAPTMVGYLIVGDYIVGALYQTGEFGGQATLQVWVVLGGYALGLLASTSARLLQSALYGAGNAKTPAVASAVRVATAGLLGVALMLQLDRLGFVGGELALLGDLPAFEPLPAAVRADAAGRLGAAGLSLAAGASAWLEYWLLSRSVTRTVGATRLGGGYLLRIAASCSIAIAAGLGVRPFLDVAHPVVAGLTAAGVVAVTSLAAATLFGLPQPTALRRAVRSR
jgi:putative peptidoglycan lipid II flippase